MHRAAYGEGWEAFSDAIRFERAGGRCECQGECGSPACADERAEDGRCPRVHGVRIADYAGRSDLDEMFASFRPVVLTTAHLCDDKTCRAHVLAMCQRCHLFLDRHHHARNAARTRDAQRGQTRLEIP